MAKKGNCIAKNLPPYPPINVLNVNKESRNIINNVSLDISLESVTRIKAMYQKEPKSIDEWISVYSARRSPIIPKIKPNKCVKINAIKNADSKTANFLANIFSVGSLMRKFASIRPKIMIVIAVCMKSDKHISNIRRYFFFDNKAINIIENANELLT